MSDTPDDFSTFLQAAMDNAGLPRPKDIEAATEGEVTNGVIYRWLRGGGEPTVKLLRPVARVLRVPLLEMLAAAEIITPIEAGLEEDPSPPPAKPTTEDEILADDQLSDDQKDALVGLYRVLRRESEGKASQRKRKQG